ncbi:hypothetical protein [Streptomyces sp. CS62]|uniref:hypothetical protein n=1 Tax=Streptomyces sp. CS62 TaxID=3119268 RepID=UPI002F92488C
MAWHDQASRDELYRDPYELYARARRAEGLTYVPEFEAWLVARDQDIREVLRRADDFSSANALLPDATPAGPASAVLAGGFEPRPTVVSSDGAAHRRYRAPLHRGLAAGRVAALAPYARECARGLVDGFAARRRVRRAGGGVRPPAAGDGGGPADRAGPGGRARGRAGRLPGGGADVPAAAPGGAGGCRP